MTPSAGTLLILGGRSDIGGQLARQLCSGRQVVLAARERSGQSIAEDPSIQALSSELYDLGASAVHAKPFEALDFGSHRQLIAEISQEVGEITTAVVAFGMLGDQERAEINESHAVDIAQVDYTAQVSLLTVLSDVMQRGHIVAFSSIAGWRARRANYVYGSTKAGLDAMCQGLAGRLHGGDLALLTARPGFVIGSMTEGMKPAPMSVTPDVVAGAITAAIKKDYKHGKMSSRTLWIPRQLALLAAVMALVPRPIWRHMPR